ncbi:dehydrodolichyl diphosphate synthase complex subunit DHDDS-like [Amblyomma americanum]
MLEANLTGTLRKVTTQAASTSRHVCLRPQTKPNTEKETACLPRRPTLEEVYKSRFRVYRYLQAGAHKRSAGWLVFARRRKASEQMGAPSAVHSADGEECGVFGFVPVSWYERLLIWLLSLGPVPRTIGIIPDGNRRFARKHGVSVDDGHLAGSQVLSRVGTWCSLVGVKESVIYVFSADNFTRPQSEQNGIFSEICRRCRHVLDNVDDFRKTGRRIRCAGDLERLPNDLQRCLARVDLATVNNAGTSTVACVAYSSRRQVARMARRLAQAVKEGNLRSDDITAELVDGYASLEDGDGVEMLLRTSGETRLSDFLLWQSSHACLHFEPKTLPEITFGDYLWALVGFQVRYWQLAAARSRGRLSLASKDTPVERSFRQLSFLKSVEAERTAHLQRLAHL